jgi:hypothetical protein
VLGNTKIKTDGTFPIAADSTVILTTGGREVREHFDNSIKSMETLFKIYIYIYIYIYIQNFAYNFKELLFTWSPFVTSLRFPDHCLRTPEQVQCQAFKKKTKKGGGGE